MTPMPMVRKFVQGFKQMMDVPKTNTFEVAFEDLDHRKLKGKVYGYFIDGLNAPRDHGKRGKRMAKRKSKLKA